MKKLFGFWLWLAFLCANIASATVITPAGFIPDNVTIEKASGKARIKDGAITSAKMATLNKGLSAAISFSTTSASLVDVTNATVTLTASGRPLMITLLDNGGCSVSCTKSVAATYISCGFLFYDDLSNYYYGAGLSMTAGSANLTMQVPGNMMSAFILPVAGARTYKMQAQANTASTTAAITACKLQIVEL